MCPRNIQHSRVENINAYRKRDVEPFGITIVVANQVLRVQIFFEVVASPKIYDTSSVDLFHRLRRIVELRQQLSNQLFALSEGKTDVGLQPRGMGCYFGGYWY